MGTLSRILSFHRGSDPVESVYFLTRWLVDGSEKANGSWKQWNCDGNEILFDLRTLFDRVSNSTLKEKIYIYTYIFKNDNPKSQWIVETCASLFVIIYSPKFPRENKPKMNREKKKEERKKKKHRHKHVVPPSTQQLYVITVVVQFTRVAGVQGLCTYGRYTLGAL